MIARRVLAAILAVSALLFNFAIERVLESAEGPLVLIPQVLDYARRWNRGVSFSLFWQSNANGRIFLIAILTLVATFMGVLAWRSVNRLQAAGYGLVVGGALGNLADRLFFNGAVLDYLLLHIGRIPLFVFNFSDAAISVGVLLLVADAATPTKFERS